MNLQNVLLPQYELIAKLLRTEGTLRLTIGTRVAQREPESILVRETRWILAPNLLVQLLRPVHIVGHVRLYQMIPNGQVPSKFLLDWERYRLVVRQTTQLSHNFLNGLGLVR